MQDVRNLADLVRAAAGGRDRPALRWRDRIMTWREFDDRVDALAATLVGEPGDRVVVAMPDAPGFAVGYFAVLRAGLVAVPVNPGLTRAEIGHVVADSGAVGLVATPAGCAVFAGADRPVRHAYPLDPATGAPAGNGASSGNGAPSGGAAGDGAAGNGEDLAALLYTSGAVGAPKAAMLPHRALLANHAQLARLATTPVRPDDVVLIAVPLHHAYGLNTALGAVAYHGACGVLSDGAEPTEVLDMVGRYGVTVVIGAPGTYAAWSLMADRAAEAFAGVRLAVSGSAPLDPVVARRFAALTGVTVHQGYGLTETGPVLTSTLASPLAKPGSIGRPLPGVSLRLVDAAGGEIVPDDGEDDEAGGEAGPAPVAGSPGTDPGEIVVRGDNLFRGYWPDGRDGPADEGWWATGDVAYADADGDLFLVDRLGEVIAVSGFSVYPTEVEQVLTAHPGIAEAAVVGVPDSATGQAVKAYVVREPGAAVDVAELMAHCERGLARFRRPTSIEFVPGLPRTATGKVRKAALLEGGQ